MALKREREALWIGKNLLLPKQLILCDEQCWRALHNLYTQFLQMLYYRCSVRWKALGRDSLHDSMDRLISAGRYSVNIFGEKKFFDEYSLSIFGRVLHRPTQLITHTVSDTQRPTHTVCRLASQSDCLAWRESTVINRAILWGWPQNWANVPRTHWSL